MTFFYRCMASGRVQLVCASDTLPCIIVGRLLWSFIIFGDVSDRHPNDVLSVVVIYLMYSELSRGRTHMHTAGEWCDGLYRHLSVLNISINTKMWKLNAVVIISEVMRENQHFDTYLWSYDVFAMSYWYDLCDHLLNVIAPYCKQTKEDRCSLFNHSY